MLFIFKSSATQEKQITPFCNDYSNYSYSLKNVDNKCKLSYRPKFMVYIYTYQKRY